MMRSSGAGEPCAAASTVATRENMKAPVNVDTGANRRIEELIRDYLLKKKAKEEWDDSSMQFCGKKKLRGLNDQTVFTSLSLLQRNVSVLLRRIFLPLRRQHIQRRI